MSYIVEFESEGEYYKSLSVDDFFDPEDSQLGFEIEYYDNDIEEINCALAQLSLDTVTKLRDYLTSRIEIEVKRIKEDDD